MNIHRVIGFEIFLCSFVNLGRVTKSITENFLGSILEAAIASSPVIRQNSHRLTFEVASGAFAQVSNKYCLLRINWAGTHRTFH